VKSSKGGGENRKGEIERKVWVVGEKGTIRKRQKKDSYIPPKRKGKEGNRQKIPSTTGRKASFQRRKKKRKTRDDVINSAREREKKHYAP